MNFKILIMAAALLVSQSFAIIGIGAHWAPNYGTELTMVKKKTIRNVSSTIDGQEIELGSIDFSHEGFTDMQGFGFKIWMDILPIIDIEATFNIQFATYNATLYYNDPFGGCTVQPLEVELAGTPFAKATPKYVGMNGDFSVVYPITFIPIFRPYIGGGVTMFLNSFVLDEDFISSFLDSASDRFLADGVDGMTEAEARAKTQELADILADTVKEKGLTTSVGGHILVGTRGKLPIIPIATYANFKYYFGGKFHDSIKQGQVAVEIGGGIAL